MAVNRHRVVKTWTLPADIAAELEALAKRECRPASREVERALRRHLALSEIDS